MMTHNIAVNWVTAALVIEMERKGTTLHKNPKSAMSLTATLKQLPFDNSKVINTIQTVNCYLKLCPFYE